MPWTMFSEEEVKRRKKTRKGQSKDLQGSSRKHRVSLNDTIGLRRALPHLYGISVLTRKYPQRFADVAGQDHVTVTLMNALTQQRIAHGYIFSDTRHRQDDDWRILAMALNCRNAIGTAQRLTARHEVRELYRDSRG